MMGSRTLLVATLREYVMGNASARGGKRDVPLSEAPHTTIALPRNHHGPPTVQRVHALPLGTRVLIGAQGAPLGNYCATAARVLRGCCGAVRLLRGCCEAVCEAAVRLRRACCAAAGRRAGGAWAAHGCHSPEPSLARSLTRSLARSPTRSWQTRTAGAWHSHGWRTAVRGRLMAGPWLGW